MRIKKVYISVFFVMLFFALGFCDCVAWAEKEVYNWKVAMGLSKYKGHMPVDNFLRRVEEATDGRIKMRMLQPGEHPYSPVDVFKAVQDNVMQVGFTLSIYTQSVFPQMGFQDLPFMFSGGEDEFTAMTKEPGFQDIWEYVLLDPLEQRNQMLMGWFYAPGYMFAGPKWVEGFESWDGLRIRAYSKPIGEMIKLFSAVPVFVSWNEVPTALSRNMIDGFLTAVTGAYPAKLYEFPTGKWVTMVDWAVGVHWISMNRDAFGELPKDLQEVLIKACQTYQPLLQEEYNQDNYRMISLMMREYGVRTRFMDPSLVEETRKKMEPIWEEFAKTMGPEAPHMLKRVNEFHRKYMEKKKQ